jgi:hypothetical protein
LDKPHKDDRLKLKLQKTVHKNNMKTLAKLDDSEEFKEEGNDRSGAATQPHKKEAIFNTSKTKTPK